MSVVYPLTMPPPVPKSVTFHSESVVASTESPFTLTKDTFVHPGQRWNVDVQLPPLSYNQGIIWHGFINALNGIEGTFLMGNPGQKLFTYSLGIPAVRDAGEPNDKSISTRNWKINHTIDAGLFIMLPGNRLHQVVKTVTTDDIGNVVLDLFPRLRGPVKSKDKIVVNNAKGIFRMKQTPSVLIGENRTHYISFNAEEVI